MGRGRVISVVTGDNDGPLHRAERGANTRRVLQPPPPPPPTLLTPPGPATPVPSLVIKQTTKPLY